MKIICPHCGKKADKPSAAVNRARAGGFRIFCSKRCSQVGRRFNKSKAQKVAEKRIYDQAYRAKNIDRILARNREYHRRTYDPAKAAVARKKRMPRHVEYCRQPEYRRWKSQYDRQYRAKKHFDAFSEAAILCTDLNREIKARMTNYEIKRENDTINKKQGRDRAQAR